MLLSVLNEQIILSPFSPLVLIVFPHSPASLLRVADAVRTPLGRDCCILSHIHLISLSLMVQREGAKEPLIFGKHNVQGERNRGAHGMGGCHHCSGTSKDSSADVSKQDGCQVILVNYLSNKNRLVFMRHARVHALLCGF